MGRGENVLGMSIAAGLMVLRVPLSDGDSQAAWGIPWEAGWSREGLRRASLGAHRQPLPSHQTSWLTPAAPLVGAEPALSPGTRQGGDGGTEGKLCLPNCISSMRLLPTALLLLGQARGESWPCTIPAPQLHTQGEELGRNGGEIPWKAVVESQPPSGEVLLGLPAEQRKAGGKNSQNEGFVTGKKGKIPEVLHISCSRPS